MKKIHFFPTVLLTAFLALASCQKAGEPEMPPMQSAEAAADGPVISFVDNFQFTTRYSGMTKVPGGYEATVMFKVIPVQGPGATYAGVRDKFRITMTKYNYASTFKVFRHPIASAWYDMMLDPPPIPVLFPDLLWTNAPGGSTNVQGTTWTTYNGQPLEFDWCAVYQPLDLSMYDMEGEYTVVFDVTDIQGNVTRLTLHLVTYL